MSCMTCINCMSYITCGECHDLHTMHDLYDLHDLMNFMAYKANMDVYLTWHIGMTYLLVFLVLHNIIDLHDKPNLFDLYEMTYAWHVRHAGSMIFVDWLTECVCDRPAIRETTKPLKIENLSTLYGQKKSEDCWYIWYFANVIFKKDSLNSTNYKVLKNFRY